MTISTPTPAALLLTPRDAAKALAISPRTLWSLTQRGAIPHVKIGRSVRYSVAELQQWIVANKKGGPPK